ncbi:Maf-like protein YceF [hydrothermal vent metagenome]|uniref:Maf-like protein YceF n=1 Tax=hydrothermal vent metagenome TaxID=652676 RepID=A0A3B1BU18_9ZZZZ
MKLVLASTSPFRKTVLEKLGLPFDTRSPQTDETRSEGESPEQLVQRLAAAKAKAVVGSGGDALIIGSDQVAVIEGEILGKPGTHDKAVKQLQKASGKTVRFYTGLCLLNSVSGNFQLEVIPFDVVFRKLTDTQIEHYLQKEKPYNCAGSFKSEALGICLFEKLQGDDPNTLMGLPLIRLVRMLEQEGVAVI